MRPRYFAEFQQTVQNPRIPPPRRHSEQQDVESALVSRSAEQAVLNLQRTVGNQAVLQRLRANQAISVQRAYNEDGVDPSAQAAAVASRNGSPDRFCVGSATITHPMLGTVTETGQSKGSNATGQHAERRALKKAMMGVQLDQFAETDGARTGGYLHAAGIDDVDIYTELPPCGGCKPFLTAVAGQLNGDVNVTFSEPLTQWFVNRSKGKQTKMWNEHLDILGIAHD